MLDDAARQNTSMLDVLAGSDRQRSHRPPPTGPGAANSTSQAAPRKTLEEYDFTFPKRIPKAKVLRLFDCEFVAQHHSAVLIGPTGIGKRHLLDCVGVHRL